MATTTKTTPRPPWWNCEDCGELRRNLGATATDPLPEPRLCAACRGAREDRAARTWPANKFALMLDICRGMSDEDAAAFEQGFREAAEASHGER